MQFEWDPAKNDENIKKHGIAFEVAVFVFSDNNNLSLFDEQHSEDEDRWVTIGQLPDSKIVVVIHTARQKSGREWIRIISARKATKNEMKQYFSCQ